MVARFSQQFRSPGKTIMMRLVQDQARKSGEQIRIRVKSQERRRPRTFHRHSCNKIQAETESRSPRLKAALE